MRERDARRASELREVTARGITELRKRGKVREAWLIGSLAGGQFDEHSDVDVVVRVDHVDDLAEVWLELSSRVGERLDVLRFEALSPSFQRSVLDEGAAL